MNPPEIKKWLDTNGFYCERQQARLSYAACNKMREDPHKLSRCFECNEFPKRNQGGDKMEPGIIANIVIPGRGAENCTEPGCKSQQYRKAVESGQTVCYRHWKGPGARKGTTRVKGKRIYSVDEGTLLVNGESMQAKTLTDPMAVKPTEDRLTKMLIPEPDFAIEKGQVKKIEVRLPMPIIDKVNLIVSVNARNMRQINRSDVIRIMIEDACQRILDGMRAKGLIKNGEDTKGD